MTLTLNILPRVLAWASPGEAGWVPSSPGAHRAQDHPTLLSISVCLSLHFIAFWGRWGGPQENQDGGLLVLPSRHVWIQGRRKWEPGVSHPAERRVFPG